MTTRMLLVAGVLGLGGCATQGGVGVPGSPPAPASPSAPSAPSTPSAPSAPSAPSTPSASPDGAPASASRGDGTAETEVLAQTPAERREQIDGKLDASLDEFDEQLRKEQQRSAGEQDRRTAERAGAAGRAGSAGSESGSDARDAGRESRQGRDRSGDLKSEGVAGGASGTAAGTDPSAGGSAGGGGASGSSAIPSGEDDDIVARRLRKAAEAETDPELKEKLWKEYRDYKENTRGGRG